MQQYICYNDEAISHVAKLYVHFCTFRKVVKAWQLILIN
jgi:hypothetical protein